MTEESKSVDVFGIQPFAKAVEIATERSFDGVGAVLGRICLPAAEEFGLFLRDKVHAWRANNVTPVIQGADEMLRLEPDHINLHAHPRLVSKIIDESSWTDQFEVQKLWSGLLASSCTPSGNDHSNIVFIEFLSRLTPGQVKVLRYACEKSTKYKTKSFLVVGKVFTIPNKDLLEISGHSDIHTLDLEIDLLRESGLLESVSSLSQYDDTATLLPSAIGLSLYVRCQGSRKSVGEYFNLPDPEPPQSPVVPPPPG